MRISKVRLYVFLHGIAVIAESITWKHSNLHLRELSFKTRMISAKLVQSAGRQKVIRFLSNTTGTIRGIGIYLRENNFIHGSFPYTYLVYYYLFKTWRRASLILNCEDEWNKFQIRFN